MKKVVFLLLAVLMISTVFLGCDKNLASALASKAQHISLDPDQIHMKVGETIEVRAKMTDGNNKPVTVDNSKFEWSIAYGNEAIDIEPNGNTVKITAKKTLLGNAAIRISHPKALTYIQRVVHITKGEELGEGWLHDTPEYKFFKSLTDGKWIKVDSEISPIPSDSDILKVYIFEEEKKLFLSCNERNNTNELFIEYKFDILNMRIGNEILHISTNGRTISIEKKSNDTILIAEMPLFGEGSLNPPKQIYKKK